MAETAFKGSRGNIYLQPLTEFIKAEIFSSRYMPEGQLNISGSNRRMVSQLIELLENHGEYNIIFQGWKNPAQPYYGMYWERPVN